MKLELIHFISITLDISPNQFTLQSDILSNCNQLLNKTFGLCSFPECACTIILQFEITRAYSNFSIFVKDSHGATINLFCNLPLMLFSIPLLKRTREILDTLLIRLRDEMRKTALCVSCSKFCWRFPFLYAKKLRYVISFCKQGTNYQTVTTSDRHRQQKSLTNLTTKFDSPQTLTFYFIVDLRELSRLCQEWCNTVRGETINLTIYGHRVNIVFTLLYYNLPSPDLSDFNLICPLNWVDSINAYNPSHNSFRHTTPFG